MINGIFEWEKPLVELEERIQELRTFTKEREIDFSREIESLEQKADALRREIFADLKPWQRVLIARHNRRPTTLDYIEYMIDDFVELHGDRVYRDDQAIVGGVGYLDGIPVTVIGPQKGRNTKENIQRNFGLPHPEGYRKALRLMKQAAKFRRPILSLIDVVGAYPGIEAERRGQGVIIAENIRQMSVLPTPIICVITGEGGSGGALAIGVGDRLLMQEYAWYSVCSPEMCATILWKDAGRAAEAAESLCLTSHDLKRLGIIDQIVPEPLGGAHKDPKAASDLLKAVIKEQLEGLMKLDPETLVEQRLNKFRRIGKFYLEGKDVE